MIKEMIDELNRAMANDEVSFDCVRNILAQLEKLTGKKYGILKRRVTIEYGNGRCGDAWVNS